MDLKVFREACIEFIQDPNSFGHDAFADCLHHLADGLDNEELEAFARAFLNEADVP